MSPSTSTEHFRLYLLAAVLHLIRQLAHNLGSFDEALEQFPFLRDYVDELARHDVDATSDGAVAAWLARVSAWAAGVSEHLPLRALRDALGLDDDALVLLFLIGLIEEDPRFGFVIECAQPIAPAQHRPTLSLLTSWWRDSDAAGLRERIRILLDNGLLQVLNADAPRLQWVFQTPPAVFDVLRGEAHPLPAPWLRFTPAAELPTGESLTLAPPLRRVVQRIPALLRSGDAKAVIVRGPASNGRRAIVFSIAAELGRSVLELRAGTRPEPEKWALVGALATLAHAMPLVVLDLTLGERVELPRFNGFDGPVAVVVGRHGAVAGDAVEGAISLNVDMPSPRERAALWQTAGVDDPSLFARRFRMTSGNIRAAAALARTYAFVDGRDRVAPSDVRVGGRALHRELETLAVFTPAVGTWESMGVSAETLEELRNLESRCRHREQLHDRVGEVLGRQLNTGVRALFAGPSGTGKTMAARILAAQLDMDLYRLDLASVVNKYIGETEKSLNQLFSRAEELDVVLLIDEGDALLTNRTSVQTSNDRYANLETNFLLQRLETFEGIVVVTTNAASRIDPAFQRRMDVVVDFRMPDARERLAIWKLHLPSEHGVAAGWLEEAAVRCAISGGQVRNAVLHASLLAMREQSPMKVAHLERAVEREYRKVGAVCPLARRSSAET